MIIKSYEVQKNRSNLSKYNFFLLYGENFGLKKDIKEFVKKAIKDALLKIFKQNNPKNPDLWNELGDLRIRLKSSG